MLSSYTGKRVILISANCCTSIYYSSTIMVYSIQKPPLRIPIDVIVSKLIYLVCAFCVNYEQYSNQDNNVAFLVNKLEIAEENWLSTIKWSTMISTKPKTMLHYFSVLLCMAFISVTRKRTNKSDWFDSRSHHT